MELSVQMLPNTLAENYKKFQTFLVKVKAITADKYKAPNNDKELTSMLVFSKKKAIVELLRRFLQADSTRVAL